MRLLKLSLAAILAASTATNAVAQNTYVFDQRDPQYQKAIEHVAVAAQALAVAKQELEKAGAAYRLPGLDVQLMLENLRPLEDTLSVLLSPERKRMAHETLVPDGIFFTPINSGAQR